MTSIRISIEAANDHQEILISELSDWGAEGFEQTDTHLVAYFNELNFKSYEVNQLLKGLNYQTSELAEQNWNEVWEKNFQPVVVDDFCGIRAEFHQPLNGVEHEIIITPKMSFGTGHHATTHMMMAQMRDIDFKNKTVFDFGTGTGILAILAEKLGARIVEAIDVDDWSIENTRENAARNECRRIQVEQTTRLPEMEFEVILANINRNVILDYLPQLYQRLKPAGSLLLSGLLTTDEVDIVEACQALDLKLVKQVEKNQWISLLFIK